MPLLLLLLSWCARAAGRRHPRAVPHRARARAPPPPRRRRARRRRIPRLLGPGLNRAGKFPTPINPGETIAEKVDEARHLLKFALKKVLCLNAAVANVEMSKDDIVRNIVTAVNFLISLLKKNWQNMGAVYVKSTMGPSHQGTRVSSPPSSLLPPPSSHLPLSLPSPLSPLSCAVYF